MNRSWLSYWFPVFIGLSASQFVVAATVLIAEVPGRRPLFSFIAGAVFAVPAFIGFLARRREGAR